MATTTITDPSLAVPKPLALPAASKPFLDTLPTRRSIYSIDSTSPITDDEIRAIINHSVLHVPSTFNVQSARVVLLLGDQHRKLWDFAIESAKAVLGEEKFKGFGPKLEGFRGGYGSVLFFEDPKAFEALRKKLGEETWGMIEPQTGAWSEQSNGMLQHAVWTSFAAAGLGSSLQHYQGFFGERVAQEWDIPKDWSFKSQLVFGTPTGPPRQQKTFQPVDERVFVKE